MKNWVSKLHYSPSNSYYAFGPKGSGLPPPCIEKEEKKEKESESENEKKEEEKERDEEKDGGGGETGKGEGKGEEQMDPYFLRGTFTIPSYERTGRVEEPLHSCGSDFSYDLICGRAEDSDSPIRWKEVTKVFINNLKFQEEVNFNLSRFLKVTLPIGADVITLVELPYWQSAERMSKKKSSCEIDFHSGKVRMIRFVFFFVFFLLFFQLV